MTTFDALTIGLPSATYYLECWVCSWRTCLLHRFALCVSCSLFNSDVILYSASAHSSAEVTLHWSQVSYTRIRFTHSGDIRLIGSVIGDWIGIQLSKTISRYPVWSKHVLFIPRVFHFEYTTTAGKKNLTG